MISKQGLQLKRYLSVESLTDLPVQDRSDLRLP